ncbi:MAG: hypothetical protein ACJ78Q_15005 [Chloroflexia bacterium]
MRATRRRVVAIAGLVLVVLCVAVTVGVVDLGSPRGAITIQSVPIYPSAMAVSTPQYKTPTPASIGGASSPPGRGSLASVGSGSVSSAVIFFQTMDTDQQVYDFYDSQLLQAGWVSLSSRSQASSSTMNTVTMSSKGYRYVRTPEWVPSWVPFLDRRVGILFVVVRNANGSHRVGAFNPTKPNAVTISMTDHAP